MGIIAYLPHGSLRMLNGNAREVPRTVASRHSKNVSTQLTRLLKALVRGSGISEMDDGLGV